MIPKLPITIGEVVVLIPNMQTTEPAEPIMPGPGELLRPTVRVSAVVLPTAV